MYEVEVKVPADLEAVRRRLRDVDAESRDRVIQEDTYYDAPHRSFPETDEALRIRTEQPIEHAGESTDESVPDDADEGGTRVALTYKGPLIDDASKTREEVETAVESAGALETILANLGFDPAETVRKDRERFALEGYTVTLDTVDGVGEFVEVETGAGERRDLADARDGVFSLLERLGLDPDEQIRTSYLELVLES